MVGNLVGKLPPSGVMLVRISSSRFSSVLFLVTPSPLFWKRMEVHNVPEASDTNTFAEKGKSETFTEYHGISCWGGGRK